MNRSSVSEKPTILAIDASTEQCSVALLVDDEIHTEVCNTPRSHAKVILPMVDDLLGSHKIPLQSLNVLAIGIGPGSFTGIRIGVGVAQGLAYGAKLPIYTRSSLDLLAYQGACLFPEVTKIIPGLDARMGEVYWGEYTISRGEHAQPEIHLENQIYASSIGDFNRSLERIKSAGQSLGAVGHGWGVEGVHHEELPQLDASVLPSAEALAILCKHDILSGQAQFLASDAVLEPLYVRNEVAWEKRVRIRTNKPGDSVE